MSETTVRKLRIIVDGRTQAVKEGQSLAAALLEAGVRTFHHSVTGEERAPLCGMGTCFECRVEINGVPNQRSCRVFCRDGMRVRTSS